MVVDLASAGAQLRVASSRIVWTLFVAQCLGSTGILAGATINSIVGRELTGSEALATLPEALFQFGMAAAAFGWGVGMERLGWRLGLSLGAGLGASGALMAGAAVTLHSLGLFLVGLVLMGIASAALRLARFAAAEAHAPEQRASAISRVVMGGAAATVLWAGLSRGLGPLAAGMGLEPLAWPYLVAFVLFLLALAVIFTRLHPDPRTLGQALAGPGAPLQAGAARLEALPEGGRRPGVWVAMLAMVSAQAVMAMIMAVTPLHMSHHAHAVEDIALVISSHVFGMFAFSFLSGGLADRFGRGPVIITGSLLLALACLAALLSPEVMPLGFALFLLGLGWNFCFVGGSSLLADQLAAHERTRIQGMNDLLIGLVSAIGILLSGFALSTLGFVLMCVAGVFASGLLLAATLAWQLRQPPVQTQPLQPLVPAENEGL